MLRMTGAIMRANAASSVAFIACVIASIEAVMRRSKVESIFSRVSVISLEKPAEPR